MTRPYKLSRHLKRIFSKLIKKDKETYEEIKNKIKEIRDSSDPEHYKNLRNPLQKYRRVHIKKSFVLVFSYDKQKDFLYFVFYDHHDKIYKKRLA